MAEWGGGFGDRGQSTGIGGCEHYIADLLDIQQFLSSITGMVSESTVEYDNEDYFLRQFADEYLEALKMKERQLSGVHAFLGKMSQRRGSQDPSQDLLIELLNDVEPKCRNLIAMLTRLKQGGGTGSTQSTGEVAPTSPIAVSTADSVQQSVTVDPLVSTIMPVRSDVRVVDSSPRPAASADVSAVDGGLRDLKISDIRPPASSGSGASAVDSTHLKVVDTSPASGRSSPKVAVSDVRSVVASNPVLPPVSSGISLVPAAKPADTGRNAQKSSPQPAGNAPGLHQSLAVSTKSATQQTSSVFTADPFQALPTSQQQSPGAQSQISPLDGQSKRPGRQLRPPVTVAQPPTAVTQSPVTVTQSPATVTQSSTTVTQSSTTVTQPRATATQPTPAVTHSAGITSGSAESLSDSDPDNAKPIEDWIEKAKKNKPEGETKWRIDRTRPEFLQAVCEKYENAKYRELHRDLMVIFEGEEIAVDRGALTKEFFYLAFESATSGHFKDCRLMIGERGHLLPDASTDHLVHAFKFLGTMTAHAVKSGCRGLPGLSPAIQYYLVHGTSLAFIEELAPPVSIDDVADEELSGILKKLNDAANLTELDKEKLHEWMDKSNCRMAPNAGTRMLIIQTLLIYYVFKMRIRQIEALAEGMEAFNLRKFLRDNPSQKNLSVVFPSPDDIKITPEMFMAAIITRGDEFDPEAFQYLETFLRELNNGDIQNKSISDLVRFLSGSPYLPAKVVVSFNRKISLPVGHTCFSEIEVPMGHPNYNSFRNAMVQALESGMQFAMP